MTRKSGNVNNLTSKENGKGIKKPIVIQAPYAEALELLAQEGYQKTHEIAFELSDTESSFKSKYVKQTYKKFINPAHKTKGAT